MNRDIQGVFVVRIHHNMAFAISTQNIDIITYNFQQKPVVLTPQNIASDLKSLPRLVPNRTILDGVRDAFTLAQFIQTAKPEIVHVNALQDLIPAFVAVRMAARSGNRPAVVAMSRNSLTWENPKKAWLYAKIITYFADGFIALSTTHKNQLLRLGVPSEKVAVIPNPYDPECLRVNGFSTGEGNKTFKITYVAHICENKAQDVLLKAAVKVLQKCPGVQFELIGKVLKGSEDYAEKLHAFVKDHGIEQSIHFVGELPFEKVLSAVHESNIFVFPTRVEMMPRAVIEAMAIGKPVIASAVDGILDLIQTGKSGILVEPGNAEAFADAICELYENPGLAKSLGEAGQERVLDYCSPVKVGNQIHQFYRHVRSNGKPR